MARGWESKSVEEQIAEREQAKERGPKLTPEQVERERKRDAFMLQRTRVLKQIEGCRDERYRKTLESGLAFLDAEIAGLEGL